MKNLRGVTGSPPVRKTTGEGRLLTRPVHITRPVKDGLRPKETHETRSREVVGPVLKETRRDVVLRGWVKRRKGSDESPTVRSLRLPSERDGRGQNGGGGNKWEVSVKGLLNEVNVQISLEP